MSKGNHTNPLSSEFDADRAFLSGRLELPGIDLEELQTFEHMEDVRDHVHSKQYRTQPDPVVGPGGLPLRKECPAAVVQGRAFSEDQGPIQGKKKVYRNVLTRMDSIEGPLSVLRRCKESETRVKVYTRNHKQVRGIMTGDVVAFDNHWNIVLKNCQEVYIKRICNKTPSFGDVSQVLPVADLAIKNDDLEQGTYQQSPLDAPRVRNTIPSHAWPNPLRAKDTSKGWRKIVARSGASTDPLDTHCSTVMGKCSEDVKSLRQACQVEGVGGPVESNPAKVKRKRRRRKEEIRYREVKQILLRGEMIVMVAISPKADE